MTTPIFPRYNDDEIVELVSLLERILRNAKSAGRYRREVYDACDKLRLLCTTLEESISSEEEQSMYLCYFDTLGLLTLCVHGPGVKLRLIHQAIRRIEDLIAIPNGVNCATA